MGPGHSTSKGAAKSVRMVPSTCDDAHLLAKLARAEAPAAAVGFWGAATAPEATVELTGAAAPSDGTIEPLAAPRPDCGRGHIDGQGDQPIGVLLRPVSLPLRAADCLALQLELRLGRQLMRVGTPVSVLAVREAVRRVEGEHFARAEGEHVTVAFELLAEQVSRAPFNLAGRIYIQQLFERAARARERVYWHLACNPSVALGAVRTPIFIIGLPRTGSTHLHRLLCADPLSESLRLYEMLQPLPLAAPGSRRARLRAAYLRAQYRAMDLLAPGYIAANSTFHRADMDGPEEEAVLLAGCGVSMMPYVCVGGAGSAYEAAHADGRTKAAAFRYLRRFLQLVAGARQAASNSRWVLKSHYNALWADALLAEFPDAKLIITVREPLEVVQSFISYSIANLSFVADGASGEEVRAERLRARSSGVAHLQSCAR